MTSPCWKVDSITAPTYGRRTKIHKSTSVREKVTSMPLTRPLRRCVRPPRSARDRTTPADPVFVYVASSPMPGNNRRLNPGPLAHPRIPDRQQGRANEQAHKTLAGERLGERCGKLEEVGPDRGHGDVYVRARARLRGPPSRRARPPERPCDRRGRGAGGQRPPTDRGYPSGSKLSSRRVTASEPSRATSSTDHESDLPAHARRAAGARPARGRR